MSSFPNLKGKKLRLREMKSGAPHVPTCARGSEPHLGSGSACLTAQHKLFPSRSIQSYIWILMSYHQQLAVKESQLHH